MRVHVEAAAGNTIMRHLKERKKERKEEEKIYNTQKDTQKTHNNQEHEKW
jgi:hypothetical protein